MKFKKNILLLVIIALTVIIFSQPSLAKEDVVQLTSEDTIESSPAWSSDGTKIAYTVQESNEKSIWIMNSDGTSKEKLTDGYSPDWSPDGKKIVYRSQRGIYIIDIDGSNQIFFEEIGGYVPDWSPDGTKILLSNSGNIWVSDTDGTNFQTLTSDTKDEASPDWSPDGTKIAYVVFQGGIGNNDIWVMNSDGSNQVKLISGTNNGASQPAWSPDGTKIAYTDDLKVVGSNIMVANADGTDKRKITEKKDKISDYDPVWSPDGTKIAFTRFDFSDVDNVKDDIFVITVEDNGSSTSIQGFGLIFAVISLFMAILIKKNEGD